MILVDRRRGYYHCKVNIVGNDNTSCCLVGQYFTVTPKIPKKYTPLIFPEIVIKCTKRLFISLFDLYHYVTMLC